MFFSFFCVYSLGRCLFKYLAFIFLIGFLAFELLSCKDFYYIFDLKMFFSSGGLCSLERWDPSVHRTLWWGPVILFLLIFFGGGEWHFLNMANYPSLLSVAAINTTHNQTQLGERKGLFGLQSPSSREAWAGRGRNWKRRCAGGLFTGLFLMASSVTFPIQPRPACPRTGQPILGWAHPSQLTIKNTPHTHTQDAHRPVS